MFCKDNKYVIMEIKGRGQKKEEERESGLARNGSLTLL